MRCPNCGLENPPSAQRCDCAYDFAAGKVRGDGRAVPGRTTLGAGMLALSLLVPFAGLILFIVYRSQRRIGAANLAALLGFFCLLLYGLGVFQFEVRL